MVGYLTRKFCELVAVPPVVVTVILPVVAPPGTVAVICDAELAVNDAGVPLNATRVAPVKFEPLIVTVVPTGPWLGVNELIAGAGAGAVVIVKLLVVVAVCPAAATEIGPLVAAAGTVAVIEVSDATV